MLRCINNETGEDDGPVDGDFICMITHNSNPRKTTFLIKEDEETGITYIAYKDEKTGFPVTEVATPEVLAALRDRHKKTLEELKPYRNPWKTVAAFFAMGLLMSLVNKVHENTGRVEQERVIKKQVDGEVFYVLEKYDIHYGEEEEPHFANIISPAEYMDWLVTQTDMGEEERNKVAEDILKTKRNSSSPLEFVPLNPDGSRKE